MGHYSISASIAGSAAACRISYTIDCVSKDRSGHRRDALSGSHCVPEPAFEQDGGNTKTVLGQDFGLIRLFTRKEV